jgi:hypothetical protein
VGHLLSSAATKKLNRNVLAPGREDKCVDPGQCESGMSLKKHASGITWVCINDEIKVLGQMSRRDCVKDRQDTGKAYGKQPLDLFIPNWN